MLQEISIGKCAQGRKPCRSKFRSLMGASVRSCVWRCVGGRLKVNGIVQMSSRNAKLVLARALHLQVDEGSPHSSLRSKESNRQWSSNDNAGQSGRESSSMPVRYLNDSASGLAEALNRSLSYSTPFMRVAFVSERMTTDSLTGPRKFRRLSCDFAHFFLRRSISPGVRAGVCSERLYGSRDGGRGRG